MKRGYSIDRRGARMLAAVQLRDDLAEYVADGGSLVAFARDRGMTERGVQKAWKAIKDGLGAQAI